MDIKKTPKTPTIFVCKKCDFKCSKPCDYERHLSTGKHQSQSQGYQNDIKKTPKNAENLFSCDNCGNKYKFYSGVWRHKKVCTQINLENYKEDLELTKIESKPDDKEPSDKELIVMLLKQNTELLDIVKNGTHNTTINNTNNNNNNKTFNLQIFLNKTCKDAMNIMDFVETIKIQLSDLMKVGELGYVEGISNIITTNLKALDVTHRPIHCMDKKRDVLYVKNENKWEKGDESKEKLRKAIKIVANENIKALTKFKEKYPDCKQSDSKYSEQYSNLLIETMGGSSDNMLEQEDVIIKNISKNVIIEKDVSIV